MRIEVLTGGTGITLDALFPESWRKRPAENARCMWLLHDKFDASGDWVSFTQAEVFAQEHGVALLCPSMNSARYNDWLGGCAWQTYFTQDLWEYAHELFPLSRDPADNALFGFGRGGFGSVKYALAFPERFGPAWAVSYDDSFVTGYMSGANPGPKKFASGYPSPAEVSRSSENIPWLVRQFAQSGLARPPIVLACAQGEPACARSAEIRDALVSEGFAVEMREHPSRGGWRFCNEMLEEAVSAFSASPA